MNEPAEKAVTAAARDLPELGSFWPEQSGYYTGLYKEGDVIRVLITAPKDGGEFIGEWGPWAADVPGAHSKSDSMANTRAMAAAGSELAKRVLALRIGGHDDWCIPACDAVEWQYRTFKPTFYPNSTNSFDGRNASSIPPGRPYTTDSPPQTPIASFRHEGAEAFADVEYWASTFALRNYGSIVGFWSGQQNARMVHKPAHVRAVRSFAL